MGSRGISALYLQGSIKLELRGEWSIYVALIVSSVATVGRGIYSAVSRSASGPQPGWLLTV